MRSTVYSLCALLGPMTSILAGCGGDGGEITTPTGSLEIRTATEGEALSDYGVSVDEGVAQPIGANATIDLANVDAGSHVVELTGLPEGCTVAGENPRTVDVTAGASTIVEFAVTCIPPGGTIQVTTATSGPASTGYDLLLDGISLGPIGANAVRSLPQTPQGQHAVGLGGIPVNCQVQEQNPQSVTLSGATAAVSFAIACTPPPAETGTLTVTTTTTGSDPDGFQVVTDRGSPQPIPLSGTLTLPNLAVGSHTVRLTGLAPNCTVNGANPRMVTVASGAAATVNFLVECAPTVGSIRIVVTTSGAAPDPDGYTYQIDAQLPAPIEVNGTATVGELAVGSHTVLLSGQAPQCIIDGDNPRAVMVSGGATAEVRFAVTCAILEDQIAFSSNGPGLQAIFLVNPDGRGLRRLTPAGVFGRDPVWSPDGSRILFATGGGLYLMNRDGGSRAQVVDAQGIVAYRWSPDGSMIAYTTQRADGEDVFQDLWVVRPDGSSASRIASNATYPSWAPDGRRIAYASDDFGDQQVHIINSDGSGDVTLTSAPVSATQTNWSPDGSQIAFVNLPDRAIMLINADGSGLLNLTQGQGDDDSPVWSPDGGTLAFTTGSVTQPLDTEVAVMARDGSGRTILTSHVGFDLSPDWSPDGSRLVFTRSDARDSEVFVMTRDGGNQVNVSNRRGTFETAPDWGGSAQTPLASRLPAAAWFRRRGT